MRKTVNSIICTGELIRKEFTEAKNSDNKEYRKVSFTVRYAPAMELIFTGRYNKYKANTDHELSKMWDFTKEVFDKYKAYVSAEFDGFDDSGKYKWKETCLADDEKADRVTCKAELGINSRIYKDRNTNELVVANNKNYKMNGMYGIAHADKNTSDDAKFTLEVFVTSFEKKKFGEEEIGLINGFGVKEGYGDYKDSVYPIVIKVPENGLDDTYEKFEEFNFKKDGVTAIFKGRILNGKETFEIGKEFDGKPVLGSKTINEYQLTMEVDPKKQIFSFADENEKAINPKELFDLIRDRNADIEKKKEDYKNKNNEIVDTVEEEEIPF